MDYMYRRLDRFATELARRVLCVCACPSPVMCAPPVPPYSLPATCSDRCDPHLSLRTSATRPRPYDVMGHIPRRTPRRAGVGPPHRLHTPRNPFSTPWAAGPGAAHVCTTPSPPPRRPLRAIVACSRGSVRPRGRCKQCRRHSQPCRTGEFVAHLRVSLIYAPRNSPSATSPTVLLPLSSAIPASPIPRSWRLSTCGV